MADDGQGCKITRKKVVYHIFVSVFGPSTYKSDEPIVSNSQTQDGTNYPIRKAGSLKMVAG